MRHDNKHDNKLHNGLTRIEFPLILPPWIVPRFAPITLKWHRGDSLSLLYFSLGVENPRSITNHSCLLGQNFWLLRFTAESKVQKCQWHRPNSTHPVAPEKRLKTKAPTPKEVSGWRKSAEFGPKNGLIWQNGEFGCSSCRISCTKWLSPCACAAFPEMMWVDGKPDDRHISSLPAIQQYQIRCPPTYPETQ